MDLIATKQHRYIFDEEARCDHLEAHPLPEPCQHHTRIANHVLTYENFNRQGICMESRHPIAMPKIGALHHTQKHLASVNQSHVSLIKAIQRLFLLLEMVEIGGREQSSCIRSLGAVMA